MSRRRVTTTGFLEFEYIRRTPSLEFEWSTAKSPTKLMGEAAFFEAHINAYRTLSCYFYTIGLAAVGIGIAGVFLSMVESLPMCYRAGEYLLFGAFSTLADGLWGIYLGCAIQNVMNGRWSAWNFLISLGIYTIIVFIKALLLAIDTAMVFSKIGKTCDIVNRQSIYLFVQIGLFGIQILIGIAYVSTVGLFDAVVEAMFNIQYESGKESDDIDPTRNLLA
ncbi:hypothetical protein AAMO2058_000951100 [Amorphochlora amoebiformis]